jgi:hypothetical protein
MRISRVGAAVLLFLVLAAATGRAQIPRNALEVRGGVAVPVGDFTDVSKLGPTFGVGYQYNPSGSVLVMFDADYSSQPAADDGFKTTILYFIGKVGVDLVDRSSPWSLVVNAGGGMMLFNFDRELFDNKTYFGTNFGLKAGRAMSRNLTIYLNAQADMALSESSGAIPTSNTWVVPVTAGLRYGF